MIKKSERELLIEERYKLASMFPGEYVVLVGTTIVHHSESQEQAIAVYNQTFGDGTPVLINPETKLSLFKPIIRGRSLCRKKSLK